MVENHESSAPLLLTVPNFLKIVNIIQLSNATRFLMGNASLSFSHAFDSSVPHVLMKESKSFL